MTTSILDAQIQQALDDARTRAARGATKVVSIDHVDRTIASPFPSPADWRDCWIYFGLTDRFNNPARAPAATWNSKYDFYQGGTFEGWRQQLPYLQKLGVGAIWLTPIVKNPKPNAIKYSYPGYSAQDFLNLDARFASDGTLATAERELGALVDEAHGRGIYVILDIVLNHAGRVFDYVYQGAVTQAFVDPNVMNGPLGSEPHIQWVDASGSAVAAWQDTLPPPAALGPDDAVWPSDFQRKEFFRRRGQLLSYDPSADGFIHGDFSNGYRQLVHEYDATVAGQEALRKLYGSTPVLSILIRIYQSMVARYDFDGFRIDTVEFIRPDLIATFGNAVREYALSIGKANFFTFGEIDTASEPLVESFVGRNSPGSDGFGIDAAIDYPLFDVLPGVLKGFNPVEQLRAVVDVRKSAEKGKISTHGEAGRYFVTFLDNHDQNQRFLTPATPTSQLTLGLAVLFSLQGIPCAYYGTEQGLVGTTDGLDANESVREALWGKTPVAFDTTNPLYVALQQVASVRASTPALRYGRIYFREVAEIAQDFGQSTGIGGLVVFSRILSDQEVVVIGNTGSATFNGRVLVDYDLSQTARTFRIAFSNLGTAATPTTGIAQGNLFANGGVTTMPIASLPVSVAPMEAQILVPM
jgi:glycosidase